MWDDEYDDRDDNPDDLFECEECRGTFSTGGRVCCGQLVVPNPDYA